MRFQRLIARLGPPTELTFTQHTDAEGLPLERIVARWDLPKGGILTFHGERYGSNIADEYRALLTRARR